jgi:hypothetical protein
VSDQLLTTEEMIEVAEYLSKGIPRSEVLAAVGISRERYARIKELGEMDTEPYKTWLEGLAQAEAKAKVEHLSKLATSPDWRCRRDLLAMTHPDLFTGAAAEHEKTYAWMLRVIQEEHDKHDVPSKVTEAILSRFATEDPSAEGAGSAAEDPKAELH